MKFKILSKLEKTNAIFVLFDKKTVSNKLKTLLPIKAQESLNLNIKNGYNNEKKVSSSSLIDINGNPTKLVLIGLGKKLNALDMGRRLGQIIRNQKFKNATIITANLKVEEENQKILTEGIIEGLYKYDTFLTSKKRQEFQPKQINFLSSIKKNNLKNAEALANSISYIKDLVNSPAIECNPSTLAKEAQQIGRKSSNIKVSVMKEKDVIKNKLNLIQSVAAGSGQDAHLITLEYKHKPTNKKPILIVGKGVTFDAGGLNIKGTGNIDSMKFDMAGAATVLGLFKMLDELRLPLHVVGMVPAVENLLGHDAYKPGDIIKSYSGKTVEITNTDAEGRLILADSLSYGIKKYKPEAVLDLATLTGACIAALGYTHTGVVSNDDKLYSKVEVASEKSGNQIWRLPLTDYHRKNVEAKIADYKNYTSGVGAGTIMAAAFLEKFVSDTPWVHFDIAGTAYLEKPVDKRETGATGEPLKLLVELLKNY